MLELIIAIMLFLFISPGQVKAYLDPGTGSYITQLVIGLILGVSYLTKVYWFKIKSSIKSLFEQTTKNVKKNNENE